MNNIKTHCVGFGCTSEEVYAVSKCEQVACSRCYTNDTSASIRIFFRIHKNVACSSCKTKFLTPQEVISHWRIVKEDTPQEEEYEV